MLLPARNHTPLLRTLTLLSILLGCCAFVACDTTSANATKNATPQAQKTYAGEYPIRVVCTTGMVADAALNVGGEHVAVTALMGEGVDPHLYKASPADVSN